MMHCFVNGNRIDITLGTTIGNLVLKLCKKGKISTVRHNTRIVTFNSFDIKISDGDHFDILLKSKLEQSSETIGIRTYLINHSKSTVRTIRHFSSTIIASRSSVETVNHNGRSLQFFSPTERVRSRAHLFNKEPGTMSWINKMNDKDVLWDIGANIGAVSLYAASLRKSKVIAIEPYHPNYTILTENIRLNNLSDRILALNLALSDKNEPSDFFVQNTSAGDSSNSFSAPVDTSGQTYKYTYSQRTLGCSIDHLVESCSLTPPTYLKIDVDGFDFLVLAGAENTLNNRIIKSISVEIDLLRPNAKTDIVAILNQYGYRLTSICGETLLTPNGLPHSPGHCFNFVFE